MASFLTPAAPASPSQDSCTEARAVPTSSAEETDFNDTTRSILYDITRWNNEGVSWIQRGQYAQAIPVLFQALAASRERIYAAGETIDPPGATTATFRGMCLDELLLTNEDSCLDSFCSSSSTSTPLGVWSSSSGAPPTKRHRASIVVVADASTTKLAPNLSIFQRPIPLPGMEHTAAASDPRDSPSYDGWVAISTVITFNTGLAIHLSARRGLDQEGGRSPASIAPLQKAAKLYQLVLCILERRQDHNENNDDCATMVEEEQEGFDIFCAGQRTFALIALNNLGCAISSLAGTNSSNSSTQMEHDGPQHYDTEDVAKCFWQIFLVISAHQQEEQQEESSSWKEVSLSGTSRLAAAVTSTRWTTRRVAQHEQEGLLLEKLFQSASAVLFDARIVPCAPSA